MARPTDDARCFPGALQDFELLTELTIQLSTSVAGRETSERRLGYASHVLTAVCLAADGILRTHPESDLRSGAKRKVWNPVATATLARVLMEACLNLHYFCIDDVSDEEREFRFLIADLHCVRERLHISAAIRASHGRFDVNSLSCDESGKVKVALAKADRVRGTLAEQLDEAKARLQSNAHFLSLTKKQQTVWATGNYNQAGRYLGSGFAAELWKRAERVGFMPSVCEADYRHCSSYVHSAPSAIDQLAAFGVNPHSIPDLVIGTTICKCSAYLSVCVRWFLSLFPELGSLVSPDACQLMEVCASYVMGPDCRLWCEATRGDARCPAWHQSR